MPDIIPVDVTIPVAMSPSVSRSLSQVVTSPSKMTRTSSNLATSPTHLASLPSVFARSQFKDRVFMPGGLVSSFKINR